MNDAELDKKLTNMTETIMGGIEKLDESFSSRINNNKTEILDKVNEMIYQSEKRLIDRLASKEESKSIESRVVTLEQKVL